MNLQMCIVSGAKAHIKLDHSFHLSLLGSSSRHLILQGLFKLNYIGPIQGASIEVPVALTGTEYFHEEPKFQNIVINNLDLF